MIRILGIDPGLRRTGYACVEVDDNDLQRTPNLVEAGVFKLDTRRSVAHRLVELERDLAEAIERARPTSGAVEKLFSHYKHPTTAVAMGHARGVILVTMTRAGIEPVELTPTQVKKSLTGNGHARKAQMQAAVQAQLRLVTMPEPSDVADAIAIALCGAHRLRLATPTGTAGVH